MSTLSSSKNQSQQRVVKLHLLLYILLPFLISCVDSLDITTDRKVNQLVVEGHITTGPGPHIRNNNEPTTINTREVAFDLYPNPAGNYTKVNLRFTSKLEGKLHLVDFTGKVIRTYSISDKETVLNINLQTLIQGVYLLKLESQNKVGVRKLIKL